ncbi:hypothetical protein D3C85_1710720 [compost metagenome]
MDLDSVLLAIPQKRPALRPGLVLVGIAQALVQGQVGGLRRWALAAQVARAGHHIAAVLGQRTHDQLRLVLGHAYAHRDVDAFRRQIDISIGQHQLQ